MHWIVCLYFQCHHSHHHHHNHLLICTSFGLIVANFKFKIVVAGAAAAADSSNSKWPVRQWQGHCLVAAALAAYFFSFCAQLGVPSVKTRLRECSCEHPQHHCAWKDRRFLLVSFFVGSHPQSLAMMMIMRRRWEKAFKWTKCPPFAQPMLMLMLSFLLMLKRTSGVQ